LGVFGERNGALLAAFAFDADVGSGPESDVGAVDRDELGDAEAGVDRERQQRAVAPSFPAVLGRGIDQRGGFLAGQVGHGASVEARGGDAEHASDRRGMFGVPQRRVAKQRANRGESEVPGPRAVVPLDLEVLENAAISGSSRSSQSSADGTVPVWSCAKHNRRRRLSR
jgi:hypothetical protein